MTGVLEPRDLPRVVTQHERRIENLEKLVRNLMSIIPRETTWDFAGDLERVESPRYPAPYGIAYGDYAITLGTAGGSSTEIDLKRNGTVMESIEIPASTQELTGNISIPLARGDYLTIETTTVGSGAKDIFVSLRFTYTI